MVVIHILSEEKKIKILNFTYILYVYRSDVKIKILKYSLFTHILDTCCAYLLCN